MSVDLRSLRLLRVSSNVYDSYIKEDGMCLPAAHFQQANLRCLNFDNDRLNYTTLFMKRGYLPSSISLFWNMQTLVINKPSFVITLPYEIWQMQQLNYLKFIDGAYLPDPDSNERSNRGERTVLQNLHTIEGVLNFRLTEEVCRIMPSIKVLILMYKDFPDECEASSYYCLHNLCRFNMLESLVCRFDGDSEWRDVSRGFRFPSSLKMLFLERCRLHWGELTVMIKSLPFLEYLHLGSVLGPEWDLVEEEFSRLKVLVLWNCVDLTNWNANSSHFPVLKILSIVLVPKLSEIPFGVGDIPTLRQIILHYSGVSTALSAMRIVVEQESLGNEDLQLRVRLQVMEEVERFKKMVQEEGLTTKCLDLTDSKVKDF